MICSVPKLRVQMTEQPARGWLPRPPQVEAHLAQRLKSWRQDGSDVIGVESRHGSSCSQLGARSQASSKVANNKETFYGERIMSRNDSVQGILWALVSVELTCPRFNSRGKNESEEKAGDQAAQMSRHTHLWRGKVESDLDHNDHHDVSQALFRLRGMTVSYQET